MLTYTVAISTFNRREVLLRCLRQVVRQTWMPKEIVVVDASADWLRTRDQVDEELANKHPRIAWTYAEARRRSLPSQRNQAAELSTGDILFMIDDDSLMYPDCAEQILSIYAADREEKVAGISAVHVPQPPDQLGTDHAPTIFSATKRYNRLERVARKILRADDVFVPYDAEYPDHDIPRTLLPLAIEKRRHLVGYGMTLRRRIWTANRFEEILECYAAGEDSDQSYRASRQGLLLTALNARLCHVGSPAGRLSPFVVAVLGQMNPLVLHRIHSSDLRRSRYRSRRLILRRMLVWFGKDVRERRLTLPYARGALFALRHVDEALSRSESDLRGWYPIFQEKLMAEHG